MGPVRQNPVQRTAVRTAHLSVLMTVHNFQYTIQHRTVLWRTGLVSPLYLVVSATPQRMCRKEDTCREVTGMRTGNESPATDTLKFDSLVLCDYKLRNWPTHRPRYAQLQWAYSNEVYWSCWLVGREIQMRRAGVSRCSWSVHWEMTWHRSIGRLTWTSCRRIQLHW